MNTITKEDINALFPALGIEKIEPIPKKRNSLAKGICKNGETVFIKKIESVHIAQKHEVKAFNLLKNTAMQDLLLPPAYSKDKYVIYKYIPHKTAQQKLKEKDPTVLQTIFSITKKMDTLHMDTLPDSMCAMNTPSMKPRSFKSLQSPPLKKLQKYVFIKEFIENFQFEHLTPTYCIHADITPSNILFPSTQESAKVVDWELCGIGDRNQDYASTYMGLYQTSPNDAESFFQFLQSRPLFNIDSFAFFLFTLAVQRIEVNPHLFATLQKCMLRICSALGSLHTRAQNLQRNSLGNFLIHQKSITPMDSPKENPLHESLFKISLPTTCFVKEIPNQENWKKEDHFTNYSHLFSAFTIPQKLYSEPHYIFYDYSCYPETITLFEYANQNQKQLKHSFEILDIITTELQEKTEKIPDIKKRSHWHRKKFLLQYAQKSLQKEFPELYHLTTTFLELFDESTIREDQLIHERLTTSKIRINPITKEIVVIDWILASLSDVNFDYTMFFLSFYGNPNRKKLLVEALQHHPSFNIYKIIYFVMERSLVSMHNSNGNRYDYSALQGWIKRFKQHISEFETEIKEFITLNQNKKFFQQKTLTNSQQKNFTTAIQKIAPSSTHLLQKYPSAIPHKTIIINQKEFYFTPLFQFQHRQFAIAYTTVHQNGKQTIVPRVFYKSLSDGTWRVCPWAQNQWYSKGKGIHYTQETKLHFGILQFLESQKTQVQESQCDIIKTFFQKEESEITQYTKEIERYDDNGYLTALQSHTAGKVFSETFSPQDYIDTIPWENKKWKSFFPDFTTSPTNTYFLTHSLLGPICLKTFPALLQNKEIEWAIASDQNNRVWIDRIQFANKDASITSYGNNAQIIDSGFLTAKPLEYKKQCTFMRQGIDYKPFNHIYHDITPLLDQFPIIQQYKQSIA